MHPPRTILVSVIVLVALAGGLAALEYGRLTTGFYSQVALSEGRGVRDRLSILLSAPLSAQSLTAKLLSQAGPDGPAPDSAEMLLLSALADEQTISSAAILDGKGVFAMASRTGNGLILYIRPGQSGGGKLESLGPDMQPAASPAITRAQIEEHGLMLAQVVKNRSGNWPAWTESHAVPGQPDPSLSAVVPAGPGGDDSRLLAFSFGVASLRSALSQDVPEGARVLVFTHDGHVLDAGGREEQAQTAGRSAPLFLPYAQSGDAVLSGAMAAWLRDGRPASEAFSFQADAKTWWASLTPLAEGEDKTSVGLALSQESLLGLMFEGRRAPLIIGSGLALALALLLVLALQSRRRAKSSGAPFFETEREIRELLDKGEGERLEFKSTLRFNLAAGKPGKEIELASLKTLTAFMNTDGGVLAVGVDDQGRTVGLEADGFENDDHALRHFSSLFAQHIGVEFLPYATFALREVDGRKILLVECRKSKEPVILKGGKDEEFYVRAGPSSRRLSLSEFMRRVVK
ncbi:helix-turn-helix domain-containing protein [Fundidesulfovibrio terrae]|uniref:AlbA family DNA-binding domain-containing protein n=1 Tax=Fundidesulfovibrio terrae TaxID=2922866 RepID=UPI001FAE8A32